MISRNKKYTELAYMILRSGKRRNPALLLSELSPAEFALLDTTLKYEEENNGRHITVNEISTDMGVSVPAVSRSLKSLEVRGIVSRVTDKNCRRNTFVIITEDGRNVFDKNMEVLGRFIKKVITSFTDEEIEQMTRFSKKINSLLTEEIDNLQGKYI